MESHANYQAREVAWYRKRGKHKARISVDTTGAEYVIGDDGWNKGERPREYIDQHMLADLIGHN